MTWTKREPPGDPDYFCDRRPCPFCFVWVAEGRPGRAEKKETHRHAGIRRFVLPALVSIAFLLTLSVTMRHEELSTVAYRTVSPPALPPIEEHPSPMALMVGNTNPVAAQWAAPASANRAPARGPTSSAVDSGSVSDADQPEVPVDFVLWLLPDGVSGRAVLRNRKAEPLLVTINISDDNVPNKYITHVSVAEVTKLSRLPVAPGDRITLSSAGYRDQVTSAN